MKDCLASGQGVVADAREREPSVGRNVGYLLHAAELKGPAALPWAPRFED